MAIEKIIIERFLYLSQDYPVFDVRSPAEFLHAHIPGANSLPLFSDEQRKVVGTAYKQQGRQKAIKIGLDYFGATMKKIVEEVESLVVDSCLESRNNFETSNEQPHTNIVLVHCWRGGMRSSAVAWLLDLYGYKVYTLAGGYKSFRNWVLQQFTKPYNFKILGGYTGSGKTVLIKELKRLGHSIIDLEGLASHKGSAFGAEDENPQPRQEMFENLIAIDLFKQQGKFKIISWEEELNEPNAQLFSTVIWLEDESQRIGALNIPNGLWEQMRNSPVCFIDIPFEERLNYIVSVYGTIEKENLINSVIRIQKRLGGQEAKSAVNFILQDNIREAFSILLRYYDRCYNRSLLNRKNLDTLLNKISCSTVSVSNVNTLSFFKLLL